MNILKNYHEITRFNLDQPQEKIVAKIKKAKEQSRSISCYFLDDFPDLQNLKVLSENKFEISVNPTMLNSFRGPGKILITLNSNPDNTKTEIITQIIPYTSAYIAAIYMVVIFLVLWTGVALTLHTNAFTTTALGWAIFLTILYLIPIINRSKLRENRNALIAILKNKTPRRNR